MATDSRRSLGSIVVALAFVAAGCVASAEADERSPELLPLATPETVTSAAEPATTTSTLPPTTTTTLPPNDCAVGPVADPFYEKGCLVLGIEVVGSGAASDAAIEAAAELVHGMVVHRPDLAEALGAGIRVAVIGADERITDLPDFADLYRLYPGTEWRRIGRSFPGTDEIPMAAGAEENLLCLEGDRFAGQNLFARDFARTILRFGLAEVDAAGQREIERAFNRAVAAGLWKETLAEVNADQYWAEITQSYFDVNGYADEDEDEDGVIAVRTRDELRRYDPAGHDVARAVYADTAWRPPCH